MAVEEMARCKEEILVAARVRWGLGLHERWRDIRRHWAAGRWARSSGSGRGDSDD